MYSYHWVAVLTLLIVCSMAQTRNIQIEPLQDSSQPQAESLLLKYSSNGDSLKPKELHSLLLNEFSQVQDMNDELLNEFMEAYDGDNNDELTLSEFEKLLKFINKDRH
ncbi:hypothetical protein UPYG_G00154540 [Umbra pygmaea]|uniref:EF-hand domain-containing protein n=1 Tax=Umbra pygmaea TaxID=75934 RepID=A0ABD0WXU6_UMBPY